MPRSLTPFQVYLRNKIAVVHPGWTESLQELEDEHGGTELIYQIPSPRNPNNHLYVSLREDEILVKFAVPGSHVHYDLEETEGLTSGARFDELWNWAATEYIRPVLENRLVAVWYGDSEGALVENVSRFVRMNGIGSYTTESWS